LCGKEARWSAALTFDQKSSQQRVYAFESRGPVAKSEVPKKSGGTRGTWSWGKRRHAESDKKPRRKEAPPHSRDPPVESLKKHKMKGNMVSRLVPFALPLYPTKKWRLKVVNPVHLSGKRECAGEFVDISEQEAYVSLVE